MDLSIDFETYWTALPNGMTLTAIRSWAVDPRFLAYIMIFVRSGKISIKDISELRRSWAYGLDVQKTTNFLFKKC